MISEGGKRGKSDIRVQMISEAEKRGKSDIMVQMISEGKKRAKNDMCEPNDNHALIHETLRTCLSTM